MVRWLTSEAERERRFYWVDDQGPLFLVLGLALVGFAFFADGRVTTILVTVLGVLLVQYAVALWRRPPRHDPDESP